MTDFSRPVEIMYRDQREMLDELSLREPSFHASLQGMLPKVLLMAAASEFEHFVCSHLKAYVSECSKGVRVGFLVERKAINRQYHTFFDWQARKAGPFWAFFGPDFKKAVETLISGDEKLREGLKAFLEIGAVRNEIIHSNYADVTLNTTLDEVYALYRKGAAFVDELPQLLRMTVPDESAPAI